MPDNVKLALVGRGAISEWHRMAIRNVPELEITARVTPLQRKTHLLGERTTCPPDPRNVLCLMIFPRHALASGPGTA